MRLHTITVLFLTLAGFALRLYYLTGTHPFFDEYTTVLAARQILRGGWPVLPSGLFYEHGLLATYLAAPFTALFIDTPLSAWQPAQWGLMLARWPSLLVSTVTIPAIYTVGHRFLGIGGGVGPGRPMSRTIALLAAGFFALSPEGMVWGGRARMYALATLLVLLTVYWAYRGALYPAPAKFRWLALIGLLATLLTQFGALIMAPPLLVAMIALGWTTHRQHTTAGLQPWFRSPKIIPELLVLGLVIGLAILAKRLGQPLGAPALDGAASASVLSELIGTVTYQTTFHFTWPDTERFLARQFGVAHHFWLSLITAGGLLVALVFYFLGWNRGRSPNLPLRPGNLFLLLLFGLIVLEMVTLLEPFRRNPRYLVMFLPLFYLIASPAIFYLLGLGAELLPAGSSSRSSLMTHPITAMLLLVGFSAIGWRDLRVALLTPEPAYETAFAHIQAQWQSGDRLLTMNTPAAELYLGRVDGFTIQNDADQFLLERETGPVDRWVGAPWIGTVDAFAAALAQGQRAWFVIDTVRQPVYFRADWLALLERQMEPVLAEDNVLLYRTRSDYVPLTREPETRLDSMRAGSIKLVGYALDRPRAEEGRQTLEVTLFWQPLEPLATDYTIFLHLRNEAGATVAQRDGQPLDGAYPTSQWLPAETVIDPVPLSLPADLPAGQYTLLTGLYRLDTLERLPVTNDASGENAIVLGQIELP